jgi:protein-disulfide isomerase
VRWDTLLLVFRPFPLAEAHPHALHAAEAAEAAGAEWKFWHDRLFLNQDRLEDEDLVEYAATVGCDVERFVRDMAEHRYLERGREYFLSGVRSGVNGTLSIFINGLRYDGPHDFAPLAAAVEDVAA